ncbi:MAG: hypothetical protein RLZZ628_84 [Bacteroidota bacterium]|jgi:hypothetical protein
MTLKKRQPFLCFVDANSYFYMRVAHLHKNRLDEEGKTLWDYLAKSMEVRFSDVVCAELNRNDQKFSAYYKMTPEQCIARHSQHLYSFRKDPTFVVEALFNKAIVMGEPDGGEKVNFAAALDAYFLNKRLAYITDESIGNPSKGEPHGFMTDLITTFPFFPIWNTYDAILHLCAQNVIHIELAQDAIIEVSSFKAKIERDTFSSQQEMDLKQGKNKKEVLNKYSELIKQSQDRMTKIRMSYQIKLNLIQKIISI